MGAMSTQEEADPWLVLTEAQHGTNPCTEWQPGGAFLVSPDAEDHLEWPVQGQGQDGEGR